MLLWGPDGLLICHDHPISQSLSAQDRRNVRGRGEAGQPNGREPTLSIPFLHHEDASSSPALGLQVAAILLGRQPPDAQVEAYEVTDHHKQNHRAQNVAHNPPATEKKRVSLRRNRLA